MSRSGPPPSLRPVTDILAAGVAHHRAGRLREAEGHYRQALQLDPNQADALHLLGLVALQAGQAAAAADLISKAVSVRPRFPEAQSNLGVALRRVGRLAEAAKAFEKALAQNPKDLAARSNLAITFKDLGRLDEARKACGLAIAQTPKDAELHYNLGNIESARGQFSEAEAAYRKALSLAPQHAQAALNLGRMLKDAGRADEALEWISRAVALKPDMAEARINQGALLLDRKDIEKAAEALEKGCALGPQLPEAHYNLGLARKLQNRMAEAEACHRQALALRADYADAWGALGSVFLLQGRESDSEDAYRKALALRPDHGETLIDLATVLRKIRKTDEALELSRRVVALRPDWAEAHLALADGLRAEGRFAEVRESLNHVVALAPDNVSARIRSALLMPVVPQSMDEIQQARREMDAALDRLDQDAIVLADPERSVSQTNFYLAYHGLDNRPLQEKTARIMAKACPALQFEAPHVAVFSGVKNRPARLGVLSANLKGHTIGKLNMGLIEKIDRARFEIVALHASPGTDPVRARIDAAAARSVTLPAGLQAAQETVAALELDLLYYPDVGMDPIVWFLAFARLAPVQALAYGHPDSTGIPALDYFLSPDSAEPEGAEAHYSETLIRLRSGLSYYYPPPPAPMRDRSHFNLPEGVRLYACPQTLFKFHPRFDWVLAEILRRDPKARIVLLSGSHPHWNEMLLARLSHVLDDPASRVIFLPRLSQDDFLAFYGVVDALLDIPDFSGGNTSYEAFALGLPIVTRPGAFMRGRTTYGLYRQMDVLDTVAKDDDEYVALALRVAQDQDFRRSVSEKIKAASARIFECGDHVREMENVFAAMLDACAKGKRLPAGKFVS